MLFPCWLPCLRGDEIEPLDMMLLLVETSLSLGHRMAVVVLHLFMHRLKYFCLGLVLVYGQIFLPCLSIPLSNTPLSNTLWGVQSSIHPHVNPQCPICWYLGVLWHPGAPQGGLEKLCTGILPLISFFQDFIAPTQASKEVWPVRFLNKPLE